jgi:hypothetical protein
MSEFHGDIMKVRTFTINRKTEKPRGNKVLLATPEACPTVLASGVFLCLEKLT